jgi:ElaB/YqjD/DUF883 family membrane-anchored ribosome-binding protein
MKEMDNLTNAAAMAARDTMEEARNIGRDAIEKGYDNTREYVSKGMDYASEISDGLTKFVQGQPWIALAGAFVIGYVAAKALRQVSL